MIVLCVELVPMTLITEIYAAIHPQMHMALKNTIAAKFLRVHMLLFDKLIWIINGTKNMILTEEIPPNMPKTA